MILGLVVVSLSIGEKARAQAACPKGDTRLYAHNDYRNARPLTDALAAGFVGAEADVFLVDGVLRLGHDRKEARRGPLLEAAYLQPLAEIASRCNRVVPERRFLLTIEIKEESRATFDTLRNLLGRYVGTVTSHVNVVMTGWHPPVSDWRPIDHDLFGTQYRITSTARPVVASGVRLISLDYGKTAGRWWRTSRGRRAWLDAIRSAKSAAPGATLRVHNVPVDSALWTRLWNAGADLIGSPQAEIAK